MLTEIPTRKSQKISSTKDQMMKQRLEKSMPKNGKETNLGGDTKRKKAMKEI